MRNSNIELFRFVLMLCICMLHMVVHGMGLKSIENVHLVEDVDVITLKVFCMPAVNCFMLISGYYSIKFSMKKVVSLCSQAFLLFIGVFLFTRIAGWGGEKLTTHYMIMHIFPISTKVWWFLTEYTIIMVLSPIINAGLNSLKIKQIFVLLLILLFMNSIGLWANYESLGSNFLSLLILYIVGRFIGLSGVQIKKIYLFLGSIFVFLTFVILIISLAKLKFYKVADMLLVYNSPMVLLYSIVLFLLIISLKPHYWKWADFLGKHCFAIYLISEKIGHELYLYWAGEWEKNYFFALSNVFFFAFIAIVVDCFQTMLNKRIVSVIVNKTGLCKFFP